MSAGVWWGWFCDVLLVIGAYMVGRKVGRLRASNAELLAAAIELERWFVDEGKEWAPFAKFRAAIVKAREQNERY